MSATLTAPPKTAAVFHTDDHAAAVVVDVEAPVIDAGTAGIASDERFDDTPFEPARFTIEMYHKLLDTGLFEGRRVELLEGALVVKRTKNSPHAYTNGSLNDIILALLGVGWHIRQQDPVSLANSEPEPDLAVVRGNRRQFADHHPSGADVGLVAEVADTSLADDRRKARIYARAGIPWYWIVNLDRRCIECFSEPVVSGRNAGYRTRRMYDEDESIPLILDGIEVGRIAVREILPPVAP